MIIENKPKQKQRKRSFGKTFPNNSKEEVIAASSKLDPIEQEIFELYYGLNGHDQLSLDELAQKCNCGKYTLQKRIIPKIKYNLKKILKNTLNNISDELNVEEKIKESEFVTENKKIDEKAYIMNKLGTTNEIEFETYRSQFRMLINFLADPIEQTILLLSLGYVRDKYYSFKEISCFLGLEELEVDNIIDRGLLNINNIAAIALNGTLSARQILKYKKQEQTN